jgi:hypothetical protein
MSGIVPTDSQISWLIKEQLMSPKLIQKIFLISLVASVASETDLKIVLSFVIFWDSACTFNRSNISLNIKIESLNSTHRQQVFYIVKA